MINEGMSFALTLRAKYGLHRRKTSVSAQNRNNGGFTLIELMVTVAILTVAVGLAVPEFLRWHVQSQLRQATTEIATELMLARMAAMNRK